MPTPGPDEIVVAVEASGVNRSDVLNALGEIPGAVDRVVPGRDFAGTVVAGPDELVGTEVWGTGGGDLGLTRDGTHAQYVRVPAAAAVPKPPVLGTMEAGAAGLAYLTAALGVAEAAPIGPGAVVLITGAAGGVGGAAAGLAKAHGATVIGAVRGADNAADARSQGVDEIVDVEKDPLPASGVDVLIDTVGPPLLHDALPALAPGGRVCLMTAPRGGALQLEVLDVYRRALRLTGLSSVRFDAVRAAELLRTVGPALEQGHLRPPRIARSCPLSEIRKAYTDVHAGTTRGRVVLLPKA